MRKLRTAVLAFALAFAVAAPVTFAVTNEAAAATKTKTKKKSYKRSDFTKEQQQKFFEEAMAICRKKYGHRLYRVEVNYARFTSVCWIY